MEQHARAIAAVAIDGTPYRDENRGLKLAGLALLALSTPGFTWRTARVEDRALFTASPSELATLVLVLTLAVNLLALGLLVLGADLVRRDTWRDVKWRRAALVKLAAANLLLPAVAFDLMPERVPGPLVGERKNAADARVSLAANRPRRTKTRNIRQRGRCELPKRVVARFCLSIDLLTLLSQQRRY